MFKKKLLHIALCLVALVLCVTLISTEAEAATYTGDCGSNITWTYDTSTFTLTLTGTGKMQDTGRYGKYGSKYGSEAYGNTTVPETYNIPPQEDKKDTPTE